VSTQPRGERIGRSHEKRSGYDASPGIAGRHVGKTGGAGGELCGASARSVGRFALDVFRRRAAPKRLRALLFTLPS